MDGWTRVARSVERDVELVLGAIFCAGALVGAGLVKLFDVLIHRHVQ